MTDQHTSTLPPPRWSTRLLSVTLIATVTVAAWLLLAGGAVVVGIAASGGSTSSVPVRLSAGAPASTELLLPCVDGEMVAGEGCGPGASPELWPSGSSLPVHRAGALTAESTTLSPLLAILAAAPLWGGLTVMGGVALLLVPVLRASASGRRTGRGFARQLFVAAAVVLVGWLLSAVGPWLAAPEVIDSLRALRPGSSEAFPVPAGWLEPVMHLEWWPLLVALLLGGLALAEHRGERLADDASGLV